MKNRVTAKNILDLLIKKHYKDLCIPECKTGPTWWDNKIYKMDLWVMQKSWAHPNTFCYEIKISRSDFLNDNKWKEYLKYCTDFYFVAPPGIIHPEELPKEVGLIITSTNIKRLFTKRKAISREVIIPESLFRYILMWRSIQKNEQELVSEKAYWKAWLTKKQVDYEFGIMVSKKIKKFIEEEINKVKQENNTLKNENNNLQKAKKILLELGFEESNFKTYYYNIEVKLRNKIKELSKRGVGDFKKYLETTVNNLQEAISIIKEGE